ncbi:MAG: c-type cytochrome [Cyclobacteriaceae bacterium]|nr:c-type cytochrome [Cyclobacteriaceae bacterium]
MEKIDRIKIYVIGILALVVIMSFVVSPDQEKSKPWDIPGDYDSMQNPYADEKEDLMDVGKSLYSKHCKSCHGTDGIGDGPKADQLETYPGDFTSDEFRDQKDGHKYYKSFIGRDEMPNYEKKIPSEEDRWAVIIYINTLYN